MKIRLSQLRKVIKEEVQKVIKENASESLLDKVYVAWGMTGMSPEEIAQERPDLKKQQLADMVRQEYGDTADGAGYAAFVQEFGDMLMDEEDAAEVADEIWSPKYSRRVR